MSEPSSEETSLHLGVGHADGRHAIGLVDELDVVKNVGAFLFEHPANLNREQADFGVRVFASSQLEKVPPGA